MLIPSRLTGLLQPADVCWFASLKTIKHYYRLWNDWFISVEKTYTRADNVRCSGYSKCIEWLSQMWIDFPEYLIQNRFERCGIVNHCNQDGALKELLKTQIFQCDYFDDVIDADYIDGFGDSDDSFDQDDGEDVKTSDNNNSMPNVYLSKSQLDENNNNLNCTQSNNNMIQNSFSYISNSNYILTPYQSNHQVENLNQLQYSNHQQQNYLNFNHSNNNINNPNNNYPVQHNYFHIPWKRSLVHQSK